LASLPPLVELAIADLSTLLKFPPAPGACELFWLRGELSQKRGHIGDALRDFGAAIELWRAAPGGDSAAEARRSEWLLTRSRLLHVQGSFDEAIADLSLFLGHVGGEHAEALHLRSLCLARTGRYTEAIEDLTRYRSLRPDDLSAALRLAALCCQLDRDREGAAAFQQIFRSCRSPPVAVFFARGLMWLRAGNHALARADLQRCLQLDAAHHQAAVHLALALEASRHFEEAFLVLKPFLARAAAVPLSAPPKLFRTAGRVLLSVGCVDGARHYLELARQQVPADPETLFLLAWCALALGAAEDARSLLVDAVRAAPHHAEAQYLLGALFVLARRDDEARAAFETALSVAPTHAAARLALARLAVERGDTAAALGFVQASIDLLQSLPRRSLLARIQYGDALFARGLLSLRQGQPLLALQDATRAVAVFEGREYSDESAPSASSPASPLALAAYLLRAESLAALRRDTDATADLQRAANVLRVHSPPTLSKRPATSRAESTPLSPHSQQSQRHPQQQQLAVAPPASPVAKSTAPFTLVSVPLVSAISGGVLGAVADTSGGNNSPSERGHVALAELEAGHAGWAKRASSLDAVQAVRFREYYASASVSATEAAIVRNALGLAHVAQGRDQEALFCFSLAAKLAPSLVAPSFNAGVLSLRMDKRKQAEDEFVRVVSVSLRWVMPC
jgi:tetratricopeptide (TPR) repeat protein